jgi:hypothetical protein
MQFNSTNLLTIYKESRLLMLLAIPCLLDQFCPASWLLTWIEYLVLVEIDGAKSFGVARPTAGEDQQSGIHFNSKCCTNSHCASLHYTSMPNNWDFVDSWLDDVLNSLKASPLKSASIKPQDGTIHITRQIALSSPPPSIRSRKPSYTPPSTSKHLFLKRKCYAHSNSYNSNNMPSPRKRTRTKDDQLSIITAPSALSDIQLPPTAYSRSSSPTKVKATSPVHELREIYRFATPPLKYIMSVDENTPQSVIDIIHGLPLHGVGVIPWSLKV